MPRKSTTSIVSSASCSKVAQTSSMAPNPNPNPNDETDVSYVIINPQNWDVHQHRFGKPKLNKNGQGKSVSMSYGGRRFYLKTPKMLCPFGASVPPKKKDSEQDSDTMRWGIQMVFGDDPECQVFQQKCQDFDRLMINTALEPDNNVGWLGASKTKLLSKEVIESKYIPVHKVYVKDGEVQIGYPPFIRITLPTTFNDPREFTCEVYDKSNKLIPINLDPSSPYYVSKIIPPNCTCTALLTGYIWIVSKTGFGITWKAAQIKVFPAKLSIPKGKCLIEDPDEDEDEDEEGEEGEEKQEGKGEQSEKGKEKAEEAEETEENEEEEDEN